MCKTSIYLLRALTIGIISFGNAQTNKNQIINKKKEKMENQFEGEEKKVFSTIEKMVDAFQNKDIKGVMACYEVNATVMFEPQQNLTYKEFFNKVNLAAGGKRRSLVWMA